MVGCDPDALTLLEQAHAGEVMGAAYFVALRDAPDLPEGQDWKLQALAAMEATVASEVAAFLAAAGRAVAAPPAGDPAKARELAAKGWTWLLEESAPGIDRALADYRAIGRRDAACRPIAARLIAHELAIRDFLHDERSGLGGLSAYRLLPFLDAQAQARLIEHACEP